MQDLYHQQYRNEPQLTSLNNGGGFIKLHEVSYGF